MGTNEKKEGRVNVVGWAKDIRFDSSIWLEIKYPDLCYIYTDEVLEQFRKSQDRLYFLVVGFVVKICKYKRVSRWIKM